MGDQTTTVTIAAEHPAFNGHFPGAPLLPGVVLLDEMLRAVRNTRSDPECDWQIGSAKFLHPVRPGETLTLEHETVASGSIRFTIRSGGRPVASGTLSARARTVEPHDGHQVG